jgi:adsorption protein B
LPLRQETDSLVVASESYIDPVSLAAIGRKLAQAVSYVIVPKGQVALGLRHWYAGQDIVAERSMLDSIVALGRISAQEGRSMWDEYVSRQLFLGDILQSLGRIDTAALSALLLRRERTSAPLGMYLVDQGVITKLVLDEALQLQEQLQITLVTLLQRAGALVRPEPELKRA